ncbi:16279_t:CDS:2 [Acaulospora morrowiae]|uniref:16279_t:CDS:1 n=1 Tax=Acaulospora morrowiae TaxID=94023 RepID=A0A9N9G8Q9_9GLOM|nr:16279_t:CDS:2 [Acaulospora morrowiae]
MVSSTNDFWKRAEKQKKQEKYSPKEKTRTTKKDKTLDIEAQIDVAYQDWCDKFEEDADEADYFCTAIPNPVPLEGKLLLEPVKELGENYDGACMFNMIIPDFDAYLNKHDKIRGLVDPTYVVAGVGGGVIPNFGIDKYPPVGPHPQLVNFANTTYAWVFNGRDRMAQAKHLVGWLQGYIDSALQGPQEIWLIEVGDDTQAVFQFVMEDSRTFKTWKKHAEIINACKQLVNDTIDWQFQEGIIIEEKKSILSDSLKVVGLAEQQVCEVKENVLYDLINLDIHLVRVVVNGKLSQDDIIGFAQTKKWLPKKIEISVVQL